MNYRLPEELGNALLAYLTRQPFADVYKLIQALQALEKLDEKEDLAAKNPQ